jgi:hypothetical protein
MLMTENRKKKTPLKKPIETDETLILGDPSQFLQKHKHLNCCLFKPGYVVILDLLWVNFPVSGFQVSRN